ncbi:MAG: enoyl-CoA hydratase/isomerase family protein [Armatimonadetes bacterium]|nr:enoyl-CoA hydratase/isomerase family protein [Armatimonadota bacterium]
MTEKQVLFETEEEVGIAILNRPEKGNPFDWSTIKEMEDILYQVEHDDSIRGMILTAKGERFFSVGADIKLMQSIEGKEYAEFLMAGLRMNEKIQRCRKPTIAAINGAAVGAGGEIAMSCDLRVASANASIGVPELKIGMIPGWGGVFRLTRLVGQAKAMEMVLTAANINPVEAKEVGLVNKVVNPNDLLHEAKALMKKILVNAPIGIALAKNIIRSEREMPFYAGESYEAMTSILTFLSKDGKEGMAAFFQKREPLWLGT